MADAPPIQRRGPALPRHAASLLLLRGGTHVLMGLRGAKHRFMPNRLVFPGGAVDRADATAPAAAEPRPDLMALLAHAARPRLSRALVLAAARELEEETGLTLGPVAGAPPALDGVDYLCRALTPPTMPIRFNARFLVADAGAVSGTLGGSGELEGLRWYGITEALALALAPVTREVLKQLVAWLPLPEPERRHREQVPVFADLTWRME